MSASSPPALALAGAARRTMGPGKGRHARGDVGMPEAKERGKGDGPLSPFTAPNQGRAVI